MRVEGKPELTIEVTADAMFDMTCENMWDKEEIT